jgi:hypothetical protein
VSIKFSRSSNEFEKNLASIWHSFLNYALPEIKQFTCLLVSSANNESEDTARYIIPSKFEKNLAMDSQEVLLFLTLYGQSHVRSLFESQVAASKKQRAYSIQQSEYNLTLLFSNFIPTKEDRKLFYEFTGYVPLLMAQMLARNPLPMSSNPLKSCITELGFRKFTNDFISSFTSNENAFLKVPDVMFRIFVGTYHFAFNLFSLL